jgi:nucleoid DNA-binding protein
MKRGCATKQEEPFMTKKEISNKIAERLGITQGLVLQAVQLVFDGILDTSVEEGHVVTFKPGREMEERVNQSDSVPGQE